MKKKIEALLKRLQIAVRHNPAEVVLSVLFCCFGCVFLEGERFLVCFLLGDARSSATAVSGVRLETG